MQPDSAPLEFRGQVPVYGLHRLRVFKGGLDDAIERLERAGLLAERTSTPRVGIVGGTSRADTGEIGVFRDGFTIVETDGRFELSSTSTKGREIDETSYDDVGSAISALLAAYACDAKSLRR